VNRTLLGDKNKLYEGFSADYSCNRLVWFERYAHASSAIAREKQLKEWTRAKKIAPIKKSNPTWVDLSEKWYTLEQLVGGDRSMQVLRLVLALRGLAQDDRPEGKRRCIQLTERGFMMR
jgi:predicted GIY-YIG superfamily endonuclease